MAVALGVLPGLRAIPAAEATTRRPTLTVPNQSIVQITATSAWDLRQPANLRVSGAAGSWAGVTVISRLSPGAFVPDQLPSQMWVSAKLYCHLSGCGAARDHEVTEALKRLRPGTYFAVVVGPPGKHSRLNLGGFTGRVGVVTRLTGVNAVHEFHGQGPANHESVLDGGYAVEATRRHKLSGFMYFAALQGPGEEALALCSNSRTELRPLAGPNACRGFSVILGPGVATDLGATVSGWYALGLVNPADDGGYDQQFYAQAGAAESQLLVMNWSVELPF